MKNTSMIKVAFGGIIFLFSVALAYFTANYFDANGSIDYWPALAAFAGVYVLIGIVVASVFAVSLGFLFSADVLILHLLIENYGKYANVYKATIIGVILLVLYIFTWLKLKDRSEDDASSSAASTGAGIQTPPAGPIQRNF